MVQKIASKSFKSLVLSKAKIKKGTVKDNIKLGDMGSWSMLFGNCEWYIPELGMTCQGTCGSHCKGCFNPDDPKKSPCYVAKSYVRKTNRNADGTIGDILTNKCTVKLGHAYRTLAMMHYRNDLLKSLDNQLTRMKKKFKVVRLNESGEIMSTEDIKMWNELARRHPETIFYIYTKNYKAVSKLLDVTELAANLFVNISVWHTYGIKEYLQLKQRSKQIRAFVLVDNDWTLERYATKGIVINSMCPAYDKNGKMNHNITCDKCKKCFGYRDECTGCHEH